MITAADRRPVVTREEAEQRYDLNVRRLLMAVLERAVRDANGAIVRTTVDSSREAVIEEARRWLYSDDCTVVALVIGFNPATFKRYLANVPKPKEGSHAPVE